MTKVQHFAAGKKIHHVHGCVHGQRLTPDRTTRKWSKVTCHNCIDTHEQSLSARQTQPHYVVVRPKPCRLAVQDLTPSTAPVVHHEDGCGGHDLQGAYATSQPDKTTCLDCLRALLTIADRRTTAAAPQEGAAIPQVSAAAPRRLTKKHVLADARQARLFD